MVLLALAGAFVFLGFLGGAMDDAVAKEVGRRKTELAASLRTVYEGRLEAKERELADLGARLEAAEAEAAEARLELAAALADETANQTSRADHGEESHEDKK